MSDHFINVVLVQNSYPLLWFDFNVDPGEITFYSNIKSQTPLFYGVIPVNRNSPSFAAVYFDTSRHIHRWPIFNPRRGHSVACIVWALSVISEVFLDPRQTKECVLYLYTKETIHRISHTVLFIMDFESETRQSMISKNWNTRF